MHRLKLSHREELQKLKVQYDAAVAALEALQKEHDELLKAHQRDSLAVRTPNSHCYISISPSSTVNLHD